MYEGVDRLAPLRVCAIVEGFPFVRGPEVAKIKDLPARSVFLLVHMEYSFKAIEKKWQERWKADQVYQVSNHSPKPKCYVLDMFPYPSGSGLHVGHPLGYIASDIFAQSSYLIKRK